MKRNLLKLLSVLVASLVISGCTKTDDIIRYKGDTDLNIYAGKDDLGRVLPTENVPEYRENKYVGIFYFVWHGARQTPGPHDVSKIIKNNPDAAVSDEAWIAAGGGAVGANHWWGEPLFGYFRNTDKWVMEKDVQMLTDAGIDFIVFDYSNGNSYTKSVLNLLEILDRYYKQGWKVPQISFVTKANSTTHMVDVYNEIYKAHPEYEHLWFRVDDKPMIIGNNKSSLDKEITDFFTIKYAQWPREEYSEDGFPWMDFKRPQTLYGEKTGTTVMSVSVAQHSGTLALSSSAFYGDKTNKNRNYHDSAIDTAEDAYLYGYNFAEQFEYAISVDPDIIFVTGWNEWIATRQKPGSWKHIDGTPNNDPVILVDCADLSNSRDIQPMKDGYGDNYYMQLISFIRKFKGISTPNTNMVTESNAKGTIDFNNGFDDWNNIGHTYIDYIEDFSHRDARGYGREVYINDTGRNDIHICKTASDDSYIYFYVQTVNPLTASTDPNWMNLFISTGNNEKSWYGYDFVINRVSPGNNQAVLERSNGGWNWSKVSDVQMMTDGNKLQIAVPIKDLGLSKDSINLQFKWADNYQIDDKASIFTFYTDGDAAPYGRLNFVYSK